MLISFNKIPVACICFSLRGVSEGARQRHVESVTMSDGTKIFRETLVCCELR